jgi:hypothetical protein
MEAATMKSDGERMRSAVTALQHAQKRLVPMAVTASRRRAPVSTTRGFCGTGSTQARRSLPTPR